MSKEKKTKSKGKATKKESAKVVTVKDLQEEYPQLEGYQIRQVIRSLGLRAPELKDQEGFGPRKKYEWDANDKDLKKIRKALDEYIASRQESAASEDEGEEEEPDSEDEEDEDEEDEDEDEDDEE